MAPSGSSDARAKAIYQDLLDRIARAYETGDFDAYALMIRVPHEVASYGPNVRLETPTDLKKLFDNIRTNLTQLGITDYIRTCLAAKFITSDEIIGTHETRLLAGSQVVERPYPVQSVLRRIDDIWWVCRSDNAIEPESGIGRALKQTSTDPGHDPDPTIH